MYSLRPATAADAPFAYHLHRATMQAYVIQTWGEWDELFQAQMFTNWFKPAQFQIVVVDDQAVGLVSTGRSPLELFVRTIEILPVYQHQGLGTALIMSILARGQADEVPVTLQVLKVNPARQLYERLGFRIVEETTTHYLMCAGVRPLPV